MCESLESLKHPLRILETEAITNVYGCIEENEDERPGLHNMPVEVL